MYRATGAAKRQWSRNDPQRIHLDRGTRRDGQRADASRGSPPKRAAVAQTRRFVSDARAAAVRPNAAAAPPAPPKAVTVVAEHPPETPRMVLTGIIVKPSETIVVLRNVATSESISLRSGESVGAWRVEAQNDHSVILTDGTQQFTLEMFTDQ